MRLYRERDALITETSSAGAFALLAEVEDGGADSEKRKVCVFAEEDDEDEAAPPIWRLGYVYTCLGDGRRRQ